MKNCCEEMKIKKDIFQFCVIINLTIFVMKKSSMFFPSRLFDIIFVGELNHTFIIYLLEMYGSMINSRKGKNSNEVRKHLDTSKEGKTQWKSSFGLFLFSFLMKISKLFLSFFPFSSLFLFTFSNFSFLSISKFTHFCSFFFLFQFKKRLLHYFHSSTIFNE